ncbi:MAG: hypothetical protein O2904_03155 [bacterium]|nr:hypothetical protein [bacterium]
MRRLHSPPSAPKKPEQNKRGSYVNNMIVNIIAAVTALTATGSELSKPLEQDAQEKVIARNIGQDYSIENIIRIVRYHYPKIQVQDLRFIMMPISAPKQRKDVMQISEMTQVAASELGNFGSEILEDPIEATGRVYGNISSSVEWAVTYRMSPNDASTMDDDAIDCNDHGEDANQMFNQHNIPSSIISIWPKDPDNRFREPWHQFSHVRLDDHTHLIVDNAHNAYLWHGSLHGFVERYMNYEDGQVEMEIIPVVGISHYVRPKYENWFSAAALQLQHLVHSESDLPTATQRRYGSAYIASRN